MPSKPADTHSQPSPARRGSGGEVPINVWLGGRSYRIRVRPEQEGVVRAAVKLADEKITEMRLHYAGRDDQDFISMVLLLYATQAATGEGSFNPVAEAQIDRMIERMDAALDPDPEG